MSTAGSPPTPIRRVAARASSLLMILALISAGFSGRAQARDQDPVTTESAPASSWSMPDVGALVDQARQYVSESRQKIEAWRESAPRWQRYSWYFMTFCGALGLYAILDRLWVLRRRRVQGGRFLRNFQNQAQAQVGYETAVEKLGLMDQCGKHKSPAANVVMSAVTRWGRDQADIERGVVLAYRLEAEKLRRRLGILKRISVLIPLAGLLCTLLMINQVLERATPEKPTTVADFAPTPKPLITGVIASFIFTIFHGIFSSRAEKLTRMLDRLGDQAVDVVMLASKRDPAIAVPKPQPLLNSKGLRIEIPKDVAEDVKLVATATNHR